MDTQTPNAPVTAAHVKLAHEIIYADHANLHRITTGAQLLANFERAVVRLQCNRDGNWMDEWGACRVCGGEIPHGHTENCDHYKQGKGIIHLTAELRKLQELNAQQLAACDCAAMRDTPETHEGNKTVQRGNPFWSPAFESVMRRTAECIELRARLAASDEVLQHHAEKASDYLSRCGELRAQLAAAEKRANENWERNECSQAALLDLTGKRDRLESQLASAQAEQVKVELALVGTFDPNGPGDCGDRLVAGIQKLRQQVATLDEACQYHAGRVDTLTPQIAALQAALNGHEQAARENITSARIIEAENQQRASASAITRDTKFIIDRTTKALENKVLDSELVMLRKLVEVEGSAKERANEQITRLKSVLAKIAAWDGDCVSAPESRGNANPRELAEIALAE